MSSKLSFLNYNIKQFNSENLTNNYINNEYSFCFSCCTKASSTVKCNNLTFSKNVTFLNVKSKNVLLKVSYTNIRSILNKISVVECNMCTKIIDLLFFTKTWLNSNIMDQNFCPLGYNIICNDKLSGRKRCYYLKIFSGYDTYFVVANRKAKV